MKNMKILSIVLVVIMAMGSSKRWLDIVSNNASMATVQQMEQNPDRHHFLCHKPGLDLTGFRPGSAMGQAGETQKTNSCSITDDLPVLKLLKYPERRGSPDKRRG